MVVLKCVWLGDSPGAELWVLFHFLCILSLISQCFLKRLSCLPHQISSLVDSSQDGLHTWILCLTCSSLSPEGFMPVRFTGDL